MFNKHIALRILKIVFSIAIFFLLFMVISAAFSTTSANLNLGRLISDIGLSPSIIGNMLVILSVLISSIVLAYILKIIRVKFLDSLFIAIAFVLLNLTFLRGAQFGVEEILMNILVATLIPLATYLILNASKAKTKS